QREGGGAKGGEGAHGRLRRAGRETPPAYRAGDREGNGKAVRLPRGLATARRCSRVTARRRGRSTRAPRRRGRGESAEPFTSDMPSHWSELSSGGPARASRSAPHSV